MVINMEEAKLQTLEQIKAFLDRTSEVAFRVPKEGRNSFIERVLKRFGYAPHGRVNKNMLLRYIGHMTGLSRQQVTRLVQEHSSEDALFEFGHYSCKQRSFFWPTSRIKSQAAFFHVISQRIHNTIRDGNSSCSQCMGFLILMPLYSLSRYVLERVSIGTPSR